MRINISSRSQELIIEYRQSSTLDQSAFFPISTSMDLISLVSFLDNKSLIASLPVKSKQPIDFIVVSLHAELLHDLYISMPGNEVKSIETADNSTSNKSLKFILLTSSGILVAACQGFDSVVTIMSIFTLPSAVILASGLIFSCFSIIAFCGFDLVKLSNSFGIKLSDAHKVLDGYFQQLTHIKHLRKKMANYTLSDLSSSELKELEQIVIILELRFKELISTSKQLDLVFNNKMGFIKSLLFGVSAALFFGGAFCSGQTVSLYILGFFMATLTPASVPVVIFSLAVGFAALSLYWYIEFPGLKILVDNWFGLNEEKIAVLCDDNALDKEAEKIGNLKKQIMGASYCKKRLSVLEKASTPDVWVENVSFSILRGPKVGKNPHSFLRFRSLSVDAVNDESSCHPSRISSLNT